MYTDALGNTHFEFWEGIKLAGRTFQSVPLYHLCQTYGDAQVRDACIHLGCMPYIQDLRAIADECERVERSFV
jgi:hypothetical protein